MIRYFANTKGLSLSAHGILTVPRTHAQFNNRNNNNNNIHTMSLKEKSFRTSSSLLTSSSLSQDTSTCAAASEENDDNTISCMKSDYLDATVTTTMSLEPLLVPYQTSPNSFKQPITEKDVFDILGLPYIPPHLRNA